MTNWLILPLLAAIAAPGEDAASRFAVGQVWEYHVREQDRGSRLKIQEIDDTAEGKVYHVSVVGVRFTTPGLDGTLPDVPLSQSALESSVTEPSRQPSTFPAVEFAGEVADWRRAKGAVYRLPLSTIIAVIDDPVGRN